MINSNFKNVLGLGLGLKLDYLVGIDGIETMFLGSAHLPASARVLVIIKHKNVKFSNHKMPYIPECSSYKCKTINKSTLRRILIGKTTDI